LWTWRPDEDEIGVRSLADVALVDSVSRYVGSEPLAAQPS